MKLKGLYLKQGSGTWGPISYYLSLFGHPTSNLAHEKWVWVVRWHFRKLRVLLQTGHDVLPLLPSTQTNILLYRGWVKVKQYQHLYINIHSNHFLLIYCSYIQNDPIRKPLWSFTNSSCAMSQYQHISLRLHSGKNTPVKCADEKHLLLLARCWSWDSFAFLSSLIHHFVQQKFSTEVHSSHHTAMWLNRANLQHQTSADDLFVSVAAECCHTLWEKWDGCNTEVPAKHSIDNSTKTSSNSPWLKRMNTLNGSFKRKTLIQLIVSPCSQWVSSWSGSTSGSCWCVGEVSWERKSGLLCLCCKCEDDPDEQERYRCCNPYF